MTIAILGWGSIVWDPRELPLLDAEWRTDGPSLPIEFGRISTDGRLTLVIRSDARRVPTLWTVLGEQDLDRATSGLAIREGTTMRHIGRVSLDEMPLSAVGHGDLLGVIDQWRDNQGLDAVIWTDLSSNFEALQGKPLNGPNAVDYLNGLGQAEARLAERYIRRAPPQIRTRVRAFIEATLGWVPLTST